MSPTGKFLATSSEDGETKTITCDGPDGYVGQLSHFTEAIRNGTGPTVVTAEEGALAVEICEAEEKSIVDGGS